MSTRGSVEWDGDRFPTPDWAGERRVCPFCTVLDCGCPHEPTIGEHIILGED